MEGFELLSLWVSVGKDALTGLAAVAGVIVASIGLGTWRAQLKGRTEYDLARRLLEATFDVRNMIREARSPMVPGGEVEAAAEALGVEFDDPSVRPLIADSTYAEQSPALSPDGRSLSYQDWRSETGEVVIRPFPEVDLGFLQVSDGGGALPRWSTDGSKLYYLAGDRLMVAELETDGSLGLRGTPRSLFLRSGVGSVEVSPDGRFLYRRQRDASNRLHVIFNWFEELKRLVPN